MGFVNKWLVTFGLLLIVVGMLLPLLEIPITTTRWIYAAGAVITLVGRIITRYKGDNLRVTRLSRIEIWSSIFFCVATFFMFYPGAGNTDWLAFTLAGGVILIYTSIMIPRALKNKK